MVKLYYAKTAIRYIEKGLLKMRGLSDSFLSDLNGGGLTQLVSAVKADDTLCMEIREDYVNVYYRGGNLYCVKKDSKRAGLYNFSFDRNYHKHKKSALSNFDEDTFSQCKNCQDYVKYIPVLKTEMDLWFGENPKYEREYQQLVLRENSYSGSDTTGNGISKDTDYFIVDVEYADNSNNSRFDMVAVKWLSTSAERRSSQNAKLALIEMKYADAAHDGTAGIVKHFEDISRFASAGKIDSLCDETEIVFNQKRMLGLIKGIDKDLKLNRALSPEFIILAANHKPDKTVFQRELRKAIDQFPDLRNSIDIKIATASNMGYGLYANDKYMLSLEKFFEKLD